jgi:hypothetical protein
MRQGILLAFVAMMILSIIWVVGNRLEQGSGTVKASTIDKRARLIYESALYQYNPLQAARDEQPSEHVVVIYTQSREEVPAKGDNLVVLEVTGNADSMWVGNVN